MITTFSTNQAFGILIEADIDIVTAEEKISFFRENINNSSQTLSYQIDELNYLVIGVHE